MRLNLKQLKWVLIGGVVFFAIAHVVIVLIEARTTDLTVRHYTRQLDLDQEYNIPTLYNWLLLTASGALSFIGFLRLRSLWWLGLSVLFIFLGLDEALLIHEQVALPIRTYLTLDNSSPFYHAWVIPGLIIVVFTGLYLLFIARRKQAINFQPNRIILYVFILALGTIVLEMVSTRTYVNLGFYRLVSVLSEEMFELSMSTFILYKIILAVTDKKDETT